MIILLDILTFIICLLYPIFIYRLLRSFLSVRAHLLWKITGYIGCQIIATTVIFPNDITNAALMFAGFILYISIFFKGQWIEKLSAVFILYPMILSINYLTEDIGRLIYNAVGTTLFHSTLIHTISLLVRLPVWIVIYYGFRTWFTRAEKALTLRMWLIVDTICLTTFVGLVTLIYYAPPATYITYPACLVSLMANLGCIYLTAYIAQTTRAEMEMQNLKVQQTYYEELEQRQLQVRKLSHDMNNHLSVIGCFLEHNEKDNALEYFETLSGKFAVSNRTFCQNSIVNAVLNAKYNLALKNQIHCFFHIDLNHMLSIDDISLCSLFANTLDNAIEAAAQIEELRERNISVKARFYNGRFSYEIKNSKMNEVVVRNGRYRSGKMDQQTHGFGLANVQDIVDKYQGTIDISYTDTSFTIVILI